MKKILLGLSLLVAAACLFVSCKSGSSPSSVANLFMKAMVEQDYTAAKKYATTESATILTQIETMSKQMKMPDSIQQMMKQATYKTSNEKVTDSTATVDVTVTLAKEIMGTKEKKETINLKKEKGEWKVDLGSLMGGGEQPEAQSPQMPADTSSMQSLPTAPDSSEK